VAELAEILSGLKSSAKAKHLFFRVFFVGSIPKTITTNALRLGQILINVIGNAIKFTERGGIEITIRLSPENQLVFSVKDTGCGVGHEHESSIFKPFVQADSSVTRKYGGTGLGLTLSQQMAKSLGGNLVLRESVLDKGSIFDIFIDAGPLEGVAMLANLNESNLDSYRQGLPPMALQEGLLQGVNVLLVEDSPDVRMLIRRFVELSGGTVSEAENGAMGIRLTLEMGFDVILMDIQMPVVDGYQAIKQIRERKYKGPVIALTAHAMSDERQRCLAAGFTDYLPKPVAAKDLIAMIRKVAGRG
jgi:CheY-like chemotaxis protein